MDWDRQIALQLTLKGLASLEPADADVGAVAEAIVKVVDTPFGKRPFRTHIDPSQDGAVIVNGVADRVRTEMSSVWKTCFRHESMAASTMRLLELTRPMPGFTIIKRALAMPFGDVAKPSNGELPIGNRQCPSWVQLPSSRTLSRTSGLGRKQRFKPQSTG
jgi:hypothetical protein